MKYCVKDIKGIPEYLKEKADEIIVYFDNTITPAFIEYLEKYIDKRVILYVEKDKDFYKNSRLYSQLAEILVDRPQYNFTLCFPQYDAIGYEQILSQKRIPFFYNIRVNQYDILNGLIEKGVSDVYITDDLGFDVAYIGPKLHEYEIQVRVFPNVAQSVWNETNDLKKFFIRPEDTYFYDELVDVYEFFGAPGQQPTFYKVYFEDKKWFGQLKELIIDFNRDIDSRHIIPNFVETRTKCRKNCARDGRCKICNRIEELSHNLEETDFYIKAEIRK